MSIKPGQSIKWAANKRQSRSPCPTTHQLCACGLIHKLVRSVRSVIGNITLFSLFNRAAYQFDISFACQLSLPIWQQCVTKLPEAFLRCTYPTLPHWLTFKMTWPPFRILSSHLYSAKANCNSFIKLSGSSRWWRWIYVRSIVLRESALVKL